MSGKEYDDVANFEKKNKNKVYVNKWILICGIIFACLAIIAVGLGVYFGTKPKSSSINTTPSPVTTSMETTSIQTTTAPPEPDIRLPQSLFPIEYVLTIQTYIPSPSGPKYDEEKNFTFDGNLTINFNCAIESQNITLLMNQITIHYFELSDMDGNNIELEPDLLYDNITQKLVFQLSNDSLKPGQNYLLAINYTGYLNDDLVGFYRSNYYEHGSVKWLAITQFEPTDARRALPCFDEPSFKANFSVTLIHPSDMKALSNAIEERTELIGDTNWSVTYFTTTPKMSTYLFAMCVAQFDSLEAFSNDGILFRVWSRISFVQDAWYAVEMGPKVLDHYTTFFNISFPLKKQDMLAIPDLAFGGMENWGMITYRERDILLDNNTYSATNLQRTATVIAHELAHMWFGDLVTLAWWNDLWLNEGFAEFFEYYGADIISNGDFQMFNQFVPLEISLTMNLDQLTSSHPIYDPALVTPDQINAAFDDISYDKGACVIRMLNQTVGSDTFHAGLIYYLKNHEYGNAAHQDLWDAVQWAVYETNTTLGWDSEPINVTALMNPWILQMNFPVVTVTRQYDDQSASMYQSRFLLPGNFSGNPAYENPIYNFTWYVPIWYNQIDGEISNLSWIEPYKTNTINGLNDTQWLIVNSGVYALYRVNYDTKNWEMLQDQLLTDHEVMDVRNRAQLLDDALNLARAGLLSYSLALNTTLYLSSEYNFVPWYSVATSLGYFQDMFALTSSDLAYGKYLQSIVQPVYKHVGWNDSDESPNDVLVHELRQFVITTMCQLGDSDCVEQASVFFNNFKTDCAKSVGTSDCSRVPNNVRKPVYCTGISQGNSEDFDFLFIRYPEEQIAVERDNILYGLCCTKAPWAINKLLTEAVNPSSKFIRQQDVEYVFNYLGTNDVGRTLIWPFFVSNWDKLADLFASGFLGIADIIQAATRSFNTESDVQQMQNFLNANSNLGSGLNAYMQQYETAETNVAWMQNYAVEVTQWFKDAIK